MKIKQLSNPWLIFGCASLFLVYVVLQMIIVNPLSPYLIDKFHLNAQQFSHASAAYLYACVIFVIPAGLFIDKFGVRIPLLAAVILNIAGATLFASTDNYSILLVSRFLCGMGNSIGYIAPLRIASVWFAPNKQAAIKGLVFTAAMLGGVLAEAPLVGLIKILGAQQVLYINIFIGIAIALAILFFVFDPAPKNNNLADTRKTNFSLLSSIKKILADKQNWLCGLFAAILNAPLMILGALWGNLYLNQAQHFDETTAAHITSLIFYGNMIGSPLLGWLSNLLKKRLPLMYISGALATLTLGCLMYIPLSLYSIGLAFFLLGIANSAQVLSYIVAAESNIPEIESTASSFVSLLINSAGLLFQLSFSWLINYAWDGKKVGGVAWYSAETYKIGFILVLLTFIVSSILPFFIKETYCRRLTE